MIRSKLDVKVDVYEDTRTAQHYLLISNADTEEWYFIDTVSILPQAELYSHVEVYLGTNLDFNMGQLLRYSSTNKTFLLDGYTSVICPLKHSHLVVDLVSKALNLLGQSVDYPGSDVISFCCLYLTNYLMELIQ